MRPVGPLRSIQTVTRSGATAIRLLAGRPPYVYCGFVGEGNLGDDAIFSAIRDGLGGGHPVSTRPGTPTFPLRLAQLATRAMVQGLVLGGGTLIGRYGWLERVQAVARVDQTRAVVCIGTGVEDAAWSGQDALTDAHELTRWAEFIRQRFDRVSVRGPRSAAILSDLGVDARVAGDPALLLTAGEATPPRDDGVIAINVGASGPIWGSQSDVNARVAEAAHELIRRGRRIRFVILWERDRATTERLAGALPASATTIVAPRSPAEAVSELFRAQVVIGQRLHAVVLASAAHTPAISLAYRPKCQDFLESIGREDMAFRTDQIDTANLVDMTMALSDNLEAETRLVREGVDPLRSILTEELAACRTLLSSGRSDITL